MTRARITPLGWLAYGLAALVVAVDQLSKFWIVEGLQLPSRGPIAVTPFFDLTMVWNRGVSFGLLRADADLARWGLAAFSVAVAVIFAVWVRGAHRRLPAVAFGLAIGGAVGNVIDRIRFGAVADFLDFSALYFPWVFNIADSAITVGMALLLLDSFVGDRKT